MFAPFLRARMDADPGLARRLAGLIIYPPLIALVLIGGGLAAIFARPPRSG